jgi:RHS repeat-associated protein
MAAWTETLYDGLGRPLTVTSGCTTVVAGGCVAGSTQNPNATATTYSYSTSSTGLATTTVAPGSKRMRHDRDGFGRLIKAVEDPLGLNLETTYANDLLDRLTQVTQGVQTRSFSYDSLGRMVSTTQPESGVTGFGYDDNGNLTGRSDGRGYAATYGYDSLNRIVSKTYSKPAPPQGQAAYADTTTAAFLWDTIFKGQMTNAVTSLNGAEVSRTENLSFDDMGRVTGSKQTTGGTISTFAYGYNKAGLLSSMTYPSGRVVASCYNSGGSPKKVTGTLGTTVTTYADGAGYASHGALASLTVGPSYAMTMGYNTHHRQLKTTEYKLGGSTLFRSSLFYCAGEADGCADNNGNVVTQKSHDGAAERVQSYTYDALNRLATGTETGGFSQTHSYDRYGNRWMSAGSSMPYGAAQTPTAATEYEASTNRNVGGSRLYDAAGNMRSEGGATAGYDGEGRLVEAMFPWGTGAVTTSYVYDAEGRRVKKTNPSIGTVVHVYDAFGQLAAEHGAGSTAGCDTCYLFTDHLGTTRAVGDKNGVVVKRRDHMPFGEEVVAPWLNGRGAVYGAATTVKPGFTGWMGNDASEWDVDYAGARYFRRGVGRFVSADGPLVDQHPEIPQSWNLFAYARNSPLVFVDPSGQYVCGSSLSEQQCKDFEASRQSAQASANALKDKYGAGSTQYKNAAAAISAYGDAGKANGVTIEIGATKGSGMVALGLPGAKTGNNPTGQNITVTFASGDAASNSGLISHEGVHVGDASAWVAAGFAEGKHPSLYQSEFDAYRVQASIAEGDYLLAAGRGEGSGFMYRPLTMGGSPYIPWFPGWPEANIANSINRILAVPPAAGGLYGLTPASKTRIYANPRARRR